MNKLPVKENLKKYTGIDSCPIRNIIARFSGKWAILVLCILAENETTRFSEISKAIPDISPKVLTETLRNLEDDSLVERTVFAEIPPRVEYTLTPIGQSLIPVIGELINWALDNFETILRHRP